MYKIIKYNKDYYRAWDNFVSNSINGTFFHKRKLINYHPEGKFNDHSLMFFDKDKLISVFPAAILDKNKRILKSHPGTSYGGLVIDKNLSLKEIYKLIDTLDNYSKSINIDVIEFRIAPKIFFKYPCDQIDFALVRNGYIRESEELSTCYYLPEFKNISDDELLMKFRDNTRRSIKKAIRQNLKVKVLDNKELITFHKILTENLSRHNTKPVHSLDEIIYLNTEFDKDVKIYGVFDGDKLISGTMVLGISPMGKHIFYSAVDYNYQKIRPVNFGVFNIIKILANNNNYYLNYGISTEDSGKIINWGLFNFKEGFNGHGILRTYWQKFLT